MQSNGRRSGEDIEERLLEFAAQIGKIVDVLPETRLGLHIATRSFVQGHRQLRIMRKLARRKARKISCIS